MRIATRLVLGILLALAGVVTVSALAWSAALKLAAANGWVNRTNEVLERIDLVLEDLVDVETGARGYVIAGEPSFLEPYERGRERRRSAYDSKGWRTPRQRGSPPARAGWRWSRRAL